MEEQKTTLKTILTASGRGIAQLARDCSLDPHTVAKAVHDKGPVRPFVAGRIARTISKYVQHEYTIDDLQIRLVEKREN